MKLISNIYNMMYFSLWISIFHSLGNNNENINKVILISLFFIIITFITIISLNISDLFVYLNK